MKLIGYLILIVLGFGIAFWIVKTTVGFVIGVLYALIPIAIVAGIGYLVYRAVGKKSLGGGGRSLP